MTRSSTERPSSSVPSQNRAEGGSSGAPGALVTERLASGTSTSAKMASRTNTVRIASPATPILFLANSLAEDLNARIRRVRANRAGAWRGLGTHARPILGSSKPSSRSAARLARITATENSRNRPCNSG